MNKEIAKKKEQLSKVISETSEIINQRRDFKKNAIETLENKKINLENEVTEHGNRSKEAFNAGNVDLYNSELSIIDRLKKDIETVEAMKRAQESKPAFEYENLLEVGANYKSAYLNYENEVLTEINEHVKAINSLLEDTAQIRVKAVDVYRTLSSFIQLFGQNAIYNNPVFEIAYKLDNRTTRVMNGAREITRQIEGVTNEAK